MHVLLCQFMILNQHCCFVLQLFLCILLNAVNYIHLHSKILRVSTRLEPLSMNSFNDTLDEFGMVFICMVFLDK
jgi:hypothetical protein